MGKTFVEKVLSQKSGHSVRAGDFSVVPVDVIMSHDTTGPMAIKSFQQMGGRFLANPERTVFILDHATPCPNEHVASLHKLIRDFAEEQKCCFYDQNYGVCHQVMLEKELVREGDIVLGGDSHTCSYGAVGAFSTGVGSTDLGAAMLTGKTWLRVPETIKIVMTGKLSGQVTAKDVILRIISDLHIDGATYSSVEFWGDGFDRFSQEEMITVCNMVIEMGAKNGVFIHALTKSEYIPDKNAEYKRVLQYKAEDIVPMVACPHSVDNVRPVSQVTGKRIDLVYLGSCTNGRLSDIALAAQILKGKTLAKGIRMIVCPASTSVMLQAMEKGYIQDLLLAGATLTTPGCSLCVGTLGGVPADGESILSTTNRNFKGRMGNGKAFIYLASPLTAAATAIAGFIQDPREV